MTVNVRASKHQKEPSIGFFSISSVTAKVINHMGSVVAFSGKSVKGN